MYHEENVIYLSADKILNWELIRYSIKIYENGVSFIGCNGNNAFGKLNIL